LKRESKKDLEDSKKFILALYQTHGAFIHYLIRKAGIEIQDKDDIFQDVMVRLIRNASALKELDQNRLNSYIALCVRSTIIDRSRDTSSKEIPMDTAELEELGGTDQVPLEKDSGWNVEILKNNLSSREWNLLVGKYIFDYDQAALAKEFGCSTGSLRMALSRVRKKARRLLVQEGGTEV